jgi:hypothetical protein
LGRSRRPRAVVLFVVAQWMIEVMTSSVAGGGVRKKIPPATEAALWALSSGTCYRPGCKTPVVVEVRPDVYRKNAWLAHVHGVRPNAARHDPSLSPDERDGFRNLLLLCYPHHAELDDAATAEELYPAETLRRWKTEHEGQDEQVLVCVRVPSDEALLDYLVAVFIPPLDRLEMLVDRLEKTGDATAETSPDQGAVFRLPSSSRTSAFSALLIVNSVGTPAQEEVPVTSAGTS